MPLYEYECETENGRRFEVIAKFSDPVLTICPTCGGPVRRLISSSAIQFKGSGFYITDYAKKSRTEAGKESKGSPTSSSSGDSSSSSSSSGDSSSGSSSSTSASSTPAAPAASTPTAKKD
jgi:putative FmdB family regulatory protein